MRVLSTTKLLAAGAMWRLFGVASAARALLDGVSSGDEEEMALAGILLVQAGDRSVTPVGQRIADRAAPGELFDVLVSIGSGTARTELEALSATSRTDVRVAARAALAQLDEIRRHDID